MFVISSEREGDGHADYLLRKHLVKFLTLAPPLRPACPSHRHLIPFRIAEFGEFTCPSTALFTNRVYYPLDQ